MVAARAAVPQQPHKRKKPLPNDSCWLNGGDYDQVDTDGVLAPHISQGQARAKHSA